MERGGRRPKNPPFPEARCSVFRKVGHTTASVKSRVNQRRRGLSTAQNRWELKSEKPLCYCAQSIPHH
jgi:hypothetical protein